MKKVLHKLTGIPLLIITGVGLAMTVVGLLLGRPYLYQLGLKLSCLLYIVLLPLCIVLAELVLLLWPFLMCETSMNHIKSYLYKKKILPKLEWLPWLPIQILAFGTFIGFSLIMAGLIFGDSPLTNFGYKITFYLYICLKPIFIFVMIANLILFFYAVVNKVLNIYKKKQNR